MMWSVKVSRGFTLLELIVVVALLGMIASVVTVRVGSSLERTRFEAAVRECATLFRMAKTHAIYQHCRVRVVYSPDSRQLRVASLVRNHEGAIKEVHLKTFRVPDVVSSFDFEASGFRTPSPDQQITFTSIGTSQGGRILMKSAKAAAKRITITPLSGVVRIEKADA